MTEQADPIVVDAIIQWADRRAAKQSQPRQNIRVLFADAAVATAVRGVLEGRSDERIWFIVRQSSDDDAVTLRHGRPKTRPAHVRDGTPLLYVVFWTPSAPGHASNAESLADLRGVTLQDFLADPELVLAPEASMLERCSDAARAWSDHRDRAELHLSEAWEMVRTVLRSDRGGRERSLPFVSHLDDYAAFLRSALIEDELWAEIQGAQRASRLVEAWGRALPALEMFQVPELASLLKIVTDPAVRPSAKPPRRKWRRDFADMLADNLDHASDHANLADIIKGKGALDEQVERLCAKIPLSRSSSAEAQKALLGFLHDRDLKALRMVDWQLKEDPDNLRSPSWGLKGVLIARKARLRVTPLDRAAEETETLLEAVSGVDSDDVEPFIGWCRDRVKDVGTRPARAREIADALRMLGEGQPPPVTVDAKSVAMLARVASSEPEPAAYAKVAQLWEKLGGGPDEAIVKAPNLMLGLARLLADRLEEHSDPNVLYVRGQRPDPADALQLSVEGGAGTRPARLELSPATLATTEGREKLRLWLRDVVFAARDVDEDDDDDDEFSEEDAEEGSDQLEITVHYLPRGQNHSLLGEIQLSWSTTARKIAERTFHDTPRAWQSESESARGGSALEAIDVFPAQSTGIFVHHCPDAVIAASASLHASTQGRGAWARAFLTAPAPAESRAFVDAWLDALRLEGAAAPDLKKRFDELVREGKSDEAFALMADQGSGTRPGPRSEAVRGLLRAWTGSRWSPSPAGSVPERIYLTPFHPLVLRFRALADEMLGEAIMKMWVSGWSTTVRSELTATLTSWGLPEAVHCYGGFYDGAPLVFDSWIGGDGLCSFSRADSAAVRDHHALGASQLLTTIQRYLSLYPAAGDTLRLRIHGDASGRWAASLLRKLVGNLSPDVRCDLDLVTTLDPRVPTDIDRIVAARSDMGRAFEMPDDGTRPRFRFRRVPEAREPVHLALILGPTIDIFRPKLDTIAAPTAVEAGVWEPCVLFALPRSSSEHHALRMGLPRDEAALRVAQAVAFGERQGSGVYVERYSFDPSVIRANVERLHHGAHWAVLIAREPLHKAMQTVGEGVAELLDFGSSIERGRPVHHCVSAGSEQFGADLARLTATLRKLLGAATEDTARGLVRQARTLAPGLAMQCAGSGTAVALQGLLGLLLTGQAMESYDDGTVAISLDQHSGLLRGSGKRGDVIALRVKDGGVAIRAGEAKLSAGAASAASMLVANGKAQLESTLRRVRHLECTHTFDARTRNALIQTITHQVEMAGPGSPAEKLLGILLDPKTLLKVEAIESSEIHAWGLEGTEEDAGAAAGEPRCLVHSGEHTRQSIAELVGTA